MSEGAPDWLTRIEEAINRHAGDPACRFLQLATARSDGRPANRTVVFRGFVAGSETLAAPYLAFTTNQRSAKVEELERRAWAEACWYFRETREQFRIAGPVTLIGELADQGLTRERIRIWNELSDESRAAFSGSGASTTPPDCFLLGLLEPRWVDYLSIARAPHLREQSLWNEGAWATRRIDP